MAEVDDPVALCVHGESLWHRMGLSALGVGWEEDGAVARRTGNASPVFLAASTIAPSATAEQLDAAAAGLTGRLTVADSHSRLDLHGLGWRMPGTQAWMARPAGGLTVPRVSGLRVAPVGSAEEVRLFERTIFEAADGNPDWAPSGSVHPAPASLHVPGLTLVIAWLDGRPVGTALAAVDGRVVQVSAVSVLRSARRRGIGAALTAAVVGLAPELPAVLSSTAMGHGVYLGLGFAEVGRRTLWDRVVAETGSVA